MDRPQCKAASKVSDYRKYHLSGDLDKQVQGKVGEKINAIENTTMAHLEELTADQLEQKLQAEREEADKLQEQVKLHQLRQQVEEQERKKQEWEVALQQVKEMRDKAAEAYEENLPAMKKMAQEALPTGGKSNSQVATGAIGQN